MNYFFQSKDEVSAFKFLHMLMQLYNYRDVYASELTNLQVNLTDPIKTI